MKNLKLFFCLAFLCLNIQLQAKHEFNQSLLNHAKKAPASISHDLEALVAYLIKPAQNQKDAALSLAYWIILNIDYDFKLYNALFREARPPEQTLALKKSVCEGYASLYKAMCDRANITCVNISGYAKGLGYVPLSRFTRTDHAWNFIEVDGEYQLMDLTWASGHAKKVEGAWVFQRDLNPSYIFADPTEFVENHLPAQPRWQLLDKPILMRAFTEYTTYEEMKKYSRLTYDYKGQIKRYWELNELQRKIRDAEDAHHFYPIPKDLAHTYEHVGYQLSKGAYDEHRLKRALDYYGKAENIYMKPASRSKGRAKRCENAILYLLKRLRNKR